MSLVNVIDVGGHCTIAISLIEWSSLTIHV